MIPRRPLAVIRAALVSRGLQDNVKVTDVPDINGEGDKRRFELLDNQGIPIRTVTIPADAESWHLALVVRALVPTRADRAAILGVLSNDVATDPDELRPELR